MRIFPTRPSFVRIANGLSPKFSPWHRASMRAALHNNRAKHQMKVASDRNSEEWLWNSV